MSIWSKIIKRKMNTEDTDSIINNEISSVSHSTLRYAIVDAEISLNDHKIHDIGALRYDGATYHGTSKKQLFEFLKNTDYICGQ